MPEIALEFKKLVKILVQSMSFTVTIDFGSYAQMC
jgi:hypothetical protein